MFFCFARGLEMKMVQGSRSAFSMAVLLLVACQPSGAPDLSSADIVAIEASIEPFGQAFESADWAALAMMYTEDAMIIPPNAPVVEGRENVRRFFESFPPITSFSFEPLEIDGRGDLAYFRGRYTLTMNVADGSSVTDSGTSFTVHRRQPDGTWPIYMDMFNSDLPAAQ